MQAITKRTFDIVVSIVLLVLLSPVLIVTAILVRLKLGAPVLFSHQRPGWREKPFQLLKFRTMLSTTDQDGNLLPDDQRKSDFGNKLRKLSIDEFPALLNVLMGDMSLVGPRPLLMRYLDHYSEEQKRRHDVRPGITGQAQVNGRNAISWEEKFEHDLFYVDNQSLLLDIKILFQTALTVFSRQGVTDGTRSIGQEPFDGKPL